jgi:hypothetical protein
MRSSRRRRNRGIALPVVVLLLLAATLLAHAAYQLAAVELRIALGMRARLGARATAERQLRRLSGSPMSLPSLNLGETLELDAGTDLEQFGYSVRVSRTASELYLVGVDAWTTEPRADYGVVRPFWSLDPVSRVGEWSAVAMLGGDLNPGSDLRSRTRYDRPDGWPPSRCAPWRDVLETLFPVSLPLVDRLDRAPGFDPMALGMLDVADLVTRADILLDGASISPGPASVSTECRASESNWGDPDGPGTPCGDRFPLIVREGDLLVQGGRGQGVLIVTGDLRFAGASRFAGLILVGGSMAVEEESTVSGLVRVGDGLSAPDGRIEGSPCAALSALEASESLRRTKPTPAQAWTDYP